MGEGPSRDGLGWLGPAGGAIPVRALLVNCPAQTTCSEGWSSHRRVCAVWLCSRDEPFQGGCVGVNVDRLIAGTERCPTELGAYREGRLERFDRGLFPLVEGIAESS
jgi:hypothetical protein